MKLPPEIIFWLMLDMIFPTDMTLLPNILYGGVWSIKHKCHLLPFRPADTHIYIHTIILFYTHMPFFLFFFLPFTYYMLYSVIFFFTNLSMPILSHQNRDPNIICVKFIIASLITEFFIKRYIYIYINFIWHTKALGSKMNVAASVS